MRKSFVLTLLLLGASLAGLIAAHGYVNRARDQVALAETVLYGDPQKARGLTLDLATHIDRRLFWNTRVRPGEAPLSETGFAYFPGGAVEERNYKYGGVYLELYTDFGTNSAGGLDLESEDLYGMGVVYRDVADRAPAGEEYREIIDLADYFEFYPFFVTLDLPAIWADEAGEYQATSRYPMNRIESMAELDAFFRIPVVKGHYIETRITKNAAGEVTGWGMSTVAGGFNLWTESALTEEGCYFTFHNRAANGEILDTSHIPGGYGIYCLPFQTKDGHPVVDMERLSMVYPLNPQTELVRLVADRAGERLLLLTREGEELLLTVIDRATMETLQRLTLLEQVEEPYFSTIYFQDDLLVPVLTDGRFAVVCAKDGGDFGVQFQADYVPADEDTHYLRYNTVMAFDGERLAMAAFTRDPYYRDENCGFYLAVYDKTGLVYMAKYGSSLDISPAAEYRYRPVPVDNNPLTLRFD